MRDRVQRYQLRMQLGWNHFSDSWERISKWGWATGLAFLVFAFLPTILRIFYLLFISNGNDFGVLVQAEEDSIWHVTSRDPWTLSPRDLTWQRVMANLLSKPGFQQLWLQVMILIGVGILVNSSIKQAARRRQPAGEIRVEKKKAIIFEMGPLQFGKTQGDHLGYYISWREAVVDSV